MPEIKSSLEEATVKAMIATGALMTKAAQDFNKRQASAATIEKLAAEAAAELVSNGRIDAEERDACVAACRDHEKVLQLLKFAAAHRLLSETRDVPADQVDRRGQPAAVKSASFRVIGARYNESNAADEQYDRDLGLAR